MEWLEWVAAIAFGIAAAANATSYAKSKNNGRLFMVICFLIAAVAFGYLAAT